MRRGHDVGPFVVVGMGRSGSSYVGGVLHRAGIDMGKEFKPADAYNQAGYYEDLEVLQAHEAWLRELNLEFGSVRLNFPLEVGPKRRKWIQEFVARREGESVTWGLKVPGILFFWAAWQQALPETAVLLVPFRHPEGVVRSLSRWNDVPRQRALAQWVLINRLALAASDRSGLPTIFLDFDDHPSLAARLSGLIGPYIDSYRPLLHHHREDLPTPALGLRGLYREMRRRADN